MKKISILLVSAIAAIALVFVSLRFFKQDNTENSTEVPKEAALLEQKYSNTHQDNLTWEYNESSKTIVISGEGPMRSYLENEPEWNYLSDEAEQIVIGDQVTNVGDGAFLLFTNLNKATLGNSIEYIGARAFDSCINLTTINFPPNLKYIGAAAFNNALLHSTNGFILPEGLIYLGESAFYSAFKESFVSMPESLTTIGKGALANCYVEAFKVADANQNYKTIDGVLYDKNQTTLINYPALKTSKVFEIPDTVKTIKQDAIETTNNLEKIIIPKNVETIEEKSIFWNYGLSYIDVSVDNINYMSVDGVLYSKDGKHLIAYPTASDRNVYTILDTTEEVQSYAISSAKNLKKLYITEGVKSLKWGAIDSCDKLEELHLPKSLNEIDQYALENNNSLKLIKYASTKSDWKRIKIADNNTTLKSNSLTIDYIDNVQ